MRCASTIISTTASWPTPPTGTRAAPDEMCQAPQPEADAANVRIQHYADKENCFVKEQK